MNRVRHARGFFSALLLAAVCLPSAAQDRPPGVCSFQGFSAHDTLAEIARATTGYRGCATAAACVAAKLAAGDVVTPYHTGGAWTCGYIQQRNGAGPGWVKNSDLRELHGDPAPPLAAWAGTWTNGDGRILITLSATADALHLAGENQWHGRGDVVHTGEFEGDARPEGNHLHFVEADAGSCTVDLTLIGDYLAVSDNQACGGMNVRFWATWKRAGNQGSREFRKKVPPHPIQQ